MHTCPECEHSGDDFEEAHADNGDVIVCPNCDWYGSSEDAWGEDE